MDSLKKSFGARIKEIRIKNKLNQEQLAELVDMDSRQISRIETGISFTSLENIEKIAKIFKVEICELFSFNHKQSKIKLNSEINSYINTATQEQLELIYKIIKVICN